MTIESAASIPVTALAGNTRISSPWSLWRPHWYSNWRVLSPFAFCAIQRLAEKPEMMKPRFTALLTAKYSFN